MLDLALGAAIGTGSTLFLVAPDDRREDVIKQLRRPAFSRVTELGIRYLPYGQLKAHREAIARFGTGLRPILDISQRLTLAKAGARFSAVVVCQRLLSRSPRTPAHARSKNYELGHGVGKVVSQNEVVTDT